MRHRLVLLLLTAAACRTEPAARAGLIPHVPLSTDQYYETMVAIGHGPRAPIPVAQLRARCLDPAVCTTSVRAPNLPERRSPGLAIIARSPGSTSAIVDYVHPASGALVTETLRVEVTPAPRYPVVALGAPAQAADDVVHEIDATALAQCRRDDASRGFVAGIERPDVRIYTCDVFVEVAPPARHARACLGRCARSEADSYTLCTQHADGVITGARMLQREHRSQAYEAKLTEGAFVGGACAPIRG